MQRAFLSPPNSLGFEEADAVLLALSLAMLFFNGPALVWRPRVPENRRLMAGLLFLSPIILRLALLRRHPVPIPSGADDFGYLLLADTLRHFRLANPPHTLPEFFEQVFVIGRPTYSAMFNLGGGILLALGWLIFGHPWAGVLLSAGALCALVYWMLLAWVDPRWAFVGGLLALMLFGPLSYWTNSYWGGAVAACAGCIVFGAVGRRNSLLLGVGLAIHLLCRPFESLFLLAGVAMFMPWRWPRLGWAALPVALSMLSIGAQNKSVTGSWTTLPYQLYRYQYGIPATFTFQRNAIPHLPLNPEKQADYDAETATHGFAPETVQTYIVRLATRVRFARFFLFAPLYIPVLLGCWSRPRIALTVVLFFLGSNFYPYFYPHYVAGVACLFLLLAITGLQRMRRAGPAIVYLCSFQFFCWYCTYVFFQPQSSTWNFLNGPDPQGRATISRTLEQQPGRHLVFVHYAPGHRFSEWVHNAADIDASPVIYANDIDPIADEQLRNQYAGRIVWLLEPDADPPRLRPFPKENKPFLDVP